SVPFHSTTSTSYSQRSGGGQQPHTSNKKSLTQKYFLWLQPCEIWCLLRKKTQYGSTLYDCVKSALENPDSSIGLYAPDPECYDVFRCLFWPVIMDYHKVDVRTLTFKHNFGNPDDLPDLSSQLNEMIVSTRARVGRTIAGFPMTAKLTVDQRLELEDRIKSALQDLDGDLAGEYKSLKDISENEQAQLREKHILFQESNDRHLESAGGYLNWPVGRGVYVSRDENFIVWVCEEDHIRIISLSNHANMREVYGRLTRAVETLNKRLDFVQHQRLGFLTFCPTNIGTALRASVHVCIPRLEKSGELNEFANKFNIQVRGTGGEHTEAKGSIYDLSNSVRLGKSEKDLIMEMWRGIEAILEREAKSQ
ncbi:unnamed protein product, partial [Didymodactylos carnosus]